MSVGDYRGIGWASCGGIDDGRGGAVFVWCDGALGALDCWRAVDAMS